jgi:RNA polymerase sigma-70 factor (ECF subfamily)
MTSPSNKETMPDVELEDFETLVEKHSDFVYNVAFRVMGDPEEAEDVAQDAFLSAYRAYDRFEGKSQVTTWLYRITMNAALMRLRKTKKARTLTQTGIDDMEIVDWTTSPEKEAANSELRDKLQAGIDLLEPDLRAALVLRDVQGMSNTEAA